MSRKDSAAPGSRSRTPHEPELREVAVAVDQFTTAVAHYQECADVFKGDIGQTAPAYFKVCATAAHVKHKLERLGLSGSIPPVAVYHLENWLRSWEPNKWVHAGESGFPSVNQALNELRYINGLFAAWRPKDRVSPPEQQAPLRLKTNGMAETQKEEDKTPASRIPPEQRTIPMSLKRAAQLMGYTNGRGEKDAVELLSKTIEDGTIRAERQNRQRYVFDKRDFPEESHRKLAPTA
jgi:hypothetical protein